jgi:sugar transferase EpsL
MIKRIFDLVLSAVILFLLLPVMAVISLLILIIQGRPIIFKQQRPGLAGKPFVILKYSTMTNEQDENGKLKPDSDRLTTLGKLLRKTSLDELPELINVIKGEMSLVGPRPLLMQYLPRYTAEQMRRHEVLPGITGWAQIGGRNSIKHEEKFKLDVWYVDHRSMWLDIRIIAVTIWKIFKREGIRVPENVEKEEFKGLA